MVDNYISVEYDFLKKVINNINVDSFKNYYYDVIDTAVIKTMMKGDFNYHGGVIVVNKSDVDLLLAYFENDKLNEFIIMITSENKKVDDYIKKYIIELIKINEKKKECDGCKYGWGAQKDHSCLYPDTF